MTTTANTTNTIAKIMRPNRKTKMKTVQSLIPQLAATATQASLMPPVNAPDGYSVEPEAADPAAEAVTQTPAAIESELLAQPAQPAKWTATGMSSSYVQKMAQDTNKFAAAADKQEAAKAETSKPDTNVAKGIIVKEEADYKVDPLLALILSTRRAFGSTGDINFRAWLLDYLQKTLKVEASVDRTGNILAITDKKSDILFSCHTDTCHSTPESNAGKPQALSFDAAFGHVFLTDRDSCGVLGADDGAGVWLMLKMIAAKVPGKYIFHAGEERGGIGAKAFVANLNNKDFIADVSAVIALDRHCRGNPEVITHQGGRECASSTTADWIVKQLNQPEFDFADPFVASKNGLYTDSKEYANLVPECLNMTVFYDKQHSAQEYLNVYELDKLCKALIAIDWHAMPINRKPAPAPVYQPTYHAGGSSLGGKHNSGLYYGYDADIDEDKPKKKKSVQPAQSNTQGVFKGSTTPKDRLEERLVELEGMTLVDITDWMETEATEAAVTFGMLLARYRALKAEVNEMQDLIGA